MEGERWGERARLRETDRLWDKEENLEIQILFHPIFFFHKDTPNYANLENTETILYTFLALSRLRRNPV